MINDCPNVQRGIQYAYDVQSGVVPACAKTINAVNRFFRDLERIKTDPNCPYYFDPKRAERYLDKAQKFHHVKGANWKTKNIFYEDWQCYLFTNLLGFFNHKTKRRRFRTAYLELSRGNGKSCVASQLGLYFLSLEGEVGPDIIIASTKKDAARIVFDSARSMALKNPSYIKATNTKVLAHTILHPPSNGVMKPISSDSKSTDGLNPSLIIGDEIHEWTRELYDVLDSSLTKRDDSLFFMITTAGLSTEGIGYEIHNYSSKVASGEMEDDTWFSLIYGIDDKDDWTDPKIWPKANPNWGVSVDPVNFEAKCKKAQETPASKYSFMVKHLNQWQNSHSPFFNLDKWDTTADKDLKIESFVGKQCWIGIDLASKIDLASIVYIFRVDGKFHVFDRTYIPEARVMDPRNVAYKRWVEEGHLLVMPGEVNDFGILQNQLLEDAKRFKIVGVNADPWNAAETLQVLIKARINALEFRMTTANLSEPTKRLDANIREGKMIHNGSGLLRWCLGNVVCKLDGNDNVFPKKSHERLKIDPSIAMIMALAGWNLDTIQTSVYESRGIRVL
jgi:phage terminase large subunit-like protein